MSGFSSPRSFSRGNRSATNRSASSSGAPTITARRSLLIRNTGRAVRTAPAKWRTRNPEYWRRRRESNAAIVERNRQQQRVRDQKRRLRVHRTGALWSLRLPARWRVEEGQLKKGRYVYYHCTGNRGKCPEPYTREEILSGEFASILQELVIPPAILD